MKNNSVLIERARELRRNLAPAEKKIWAALRGRRFGEFKFRRQQVIGPYIVDFYCSATAMILELDGESHLGQVAERNDSSRQRWLEDQGFKVIRFWNTVVFDEFEAVLETIWQECDRRRSLGKGRPLTPGPSPPEGRGEPEGRLA